MKLLLVGGISSKYSTLRLKLGSKFSTNCSSIDEMDWTAKTITDRVRYVPSLDVRTEELGKDIRFTASTLVDGKFYACSPTQLYIYSYPEFELVALIDHPHFNDVHHVNIINQKLVVTNTGLDSVMLFSLDGDFEGIFSTNGDDPWIRFDPSKDYRKVASTKPHLNHPNFSFDLDGEIWVTRFNDRDAVCLSDFSRKIDIRVGKPHDGHVHGDFIYFTTINGFVVIANKRTLKIENRIDLNAIDTRDAPLGWCRGICLDGEFAYVGFTRLRRTKIEENLRWLKEKFSHSKERLPARVAKYHLSRSELVDEFVVPEGFTDLIFSIIKKPV